jgi:hypothetical protein
MGDFVESSDFKLGVSEAGQNATSSSTSTSNTSTSTSAPNQTATQ